METAGFSETSVTTYKNRRSDFQIFAVVKTSILDIESEKVSLLRFEISNREDDDYGPLVMEQCGPVGDYQRSVENFLQSWWQQVLRNVCHHQLHYTVSEPRRWRYASRYSFIRPPIATKCLGFAGSVHWTETQIATQMEHFPENYIPCEQLRACSYNLHVVANICLFITAALFNINQSAFLD
jgi:hypothetical protein